MDELIGNTDDIQKKKELLQREIINNHYDKEKFIDFCSSKKSYGDDLARWNYTELKTVVDEFVKYHQEEDKKMQEKKQLLIENQRRQQEIMFDLEKIKVETIQYNTPGEYAKEIQCRKLEPSILSNQSVTVQVKNPKGIETGMFKANYISYDVITNVTNWIVRRRYSDFEWLRLTLRKYFPRLLIPPLPTKKLGGRRFEPDFIEKRMNLLDKFINKIVENEAFKASDCVISFLSIADRFQYECKVKELNSFIPSLFIEDSQTINGKLKVIEYNGNEQQYTQFENYIKLQSQLFNHLISNLRHFNYNLTAACQNLEEVQRDFETLKLLNSRVGVTKEISRTYDEFSTFFKNWKRILFNEKEVIKVYVKDFFKYVEMEGKAIEELIKSREELNKKYMSEHKKLMTKKDKLWATMDITKWEIIDDTNKTDRILLMRDKSYALSKMCTQETQILENLRKQIDYAYSMNQDEMKKKIDEYCISFRSNLKKFIEALYPSLNDGLNVWSHLRSNCD